MLEKKCAYFGQCGGCVWQDLTKQEYLTKKELFITRAFQDARLNINLEPIVLIPTGTRRRTSFAFIKNHFGFNENKSHKIVDIDACPLLTKTINNALPVIKKTLGQLKSCGDIFILDTPFGLDIHIKTKTGIPNLEQLEILSTLSQEPTIARTMYNNTPVFEKAPLPGIADNFLQPSLEGEETLIRLVLEAAKGHKKAVDLFCGKGTFTTPLLNKGIATIGYDSSDAVLALGTHGVQQDLFRIPLTANELNGIDLAILDPPRAGALAQTIQLANTDIKTIVMISCNPKTCARDIKILVDAGWHIKKMIPVDQFTYSNHIELVTILEK